MDRYNTFLWQEKQQYWYKYIKHNQGASNNIYFVEIKCPSSFGTDLCIFWKSVDEKDGQPFSGLNTTNPEKSKPAVKKHLREVCSLCQCSKYRSTEDTARVSTQIL